VSLLERNGESSAAFKAKHLIAHYCAMMTFCLIHTDKEKEQYIANGINLILNNHA